MKTLEQVYNSIQHMSNGKKTIFDTSNYYSRKYYPGFGVSGPIPPEDDDEEEDQDWEFA